MKFTWTMQRKKIKDLSLAEYNPRIMPEAQEKELTKSLDRFGVAEPIVVNTTLRVIGGHQRIRVLEGMGETEVDVMVPDRELKLKQEKELNLRLNKNTGEFDWAKLAPFGLDMLKDVGFDSKDLDKIFKGKDEDEDDFDLEGALGSTTGRAKTGDLWALGEHKLFVGDATKKQSYERLLGDCRASMIFTDPPYNIGYEGGMNATGQNTRKAIANDKMSKGAFSEFLKDFIAAAMAFTDGCWYVCMSSQELDNLKIQFEAGGGHWQAFIIWVKNTFTLSRSDWQNQYEPILYGWNKKVKRHYFVGWRDEGNVWEDVLKLRPFYDGKKTTIKVGDIMIEIDGKITGRVMNKKDETDIWREKRPTRSSEHPTMKPIALVERAIRASSKRDQIVLDPFLGSGTTLIASENLSRICYGMELEPKYAEVIIKRWEDKTKKKASKIK